MQMKKTVSALMLMNSLVLAGCVTATRAPVALPEMSLNGKTPGDANTCGRLILGHDRHWQISIEILQIGDLNISNPRDSMRTRFRLAPGLHQIKARNLLTGSKKRRPMLYEVMIAPNTNHYLIYVDDLVWIDKNLSDPALGRLTVKTREEACTL